MQRATYSGHKWIPCLNFEAFTAPDGPVLHLFGPVEGRRDDITFYRSPGLDEELEQRLHIDGALLYIYGDTAYVLPAYLQNGFREVYLTGLQSEHNKLISRLLIAVEWAFKDIKQHFTHFDLSRKAKIPHTLFALWYCNAVIL